MIKPYKGSNNKFKIGDFVTLHPNKDFKDIGFRLDRKIDVKNSYEVIDIWVGSTYDIWGKGINYVLDTKASDWVNFDTQYPESYLRPYEKGGKRMSKFKKGDRVKLNPNMDHSIYVSGVEDVLRERLFSLLKG